MTTWILPIKPKWAADIYSGEKTIEVRRHVPASLAYDSLKPAFSVLLYETRPVQAITGQCMMMTTGYSIECYAVTDDQLRLACLTREEFEKYVGWDELWPAEFVSLLSVTEPERFAQPQTLADHGLTRAPQSWVRSRKEVPDANAK